MYSPHTPASGSPRGHAVEKTVVGRRVHLPGESYCCACGPRAQAGRGTPTSIGRTSTSLRSVAELQLSEYHRLLLRGAPRRDRLPNLAYAAAAFRLALRARGFIGVGPGAWSLASVRRGALGDRRLGGLALRSRMAASTGMAEAEPRAPQRTGVTAESVPRKRSSAADIIRAMTPLPDPRLSAAILAARSARFASRTLKTGGGSTVPGVVARRVDPRVLTKLSRRLRLGSAAITGTNGKTTTTRMVSKILQTAGVRAALVSDSGLAGAPLSQMGLFEVDEASVPKVAAEAEIEILAVLNLFRDQLDRYGELAYTGKVIASDFGDLPQSGAVVLNSDDPLVASLGRSARRPVFYGVDEPALDTGRLQHVADSKDCPICGTSLVYEAA